MDAEKTRSLFKELDRFFSMIEHRAANIKIQFEATRNSIDDDLILQLEKGMKRMDEWLKVIRKSIVDIELTLDSLNATDEDVEQLYEEVDSLSALYQAKKLQLSIIHDHIKAHQGVDRLHRKLWPSTATHDRR